MNKQLRIGETPADRVTDDSIEDHLLEQIVGGRGRGHSRVSRKRMQDAAAEAVAESAEPTHYGKFGGPVHHTPDPQPEPAPTPAPAPAPAVAADPTPMPDADVEVPSIAAQVMSDLPADEPTYEDPRGDGGEEERPDFDLTTSYTAEADNMKSVYSAGIEGVLRADSEGAAVGFGLKASIETEIDLGSGATVTATTEAAISAGAQIMYHNGIGAEAAAEISAKVAWEITRQTDMGNGVTMDNSGKVEGFMGASAEGEGYIGEKGGKWGFDAKAGADYTAETKGTIDASQVAMTGEASVSSSGSIGAAFSQEATYEHGALTIGLSGDIDAVLAGGGLGGSVSVQFEDKYGTVGSAEEIAAIQAQLQHFDSAADLDRSLSETWHNDLEKDAERMRDEADWAERRLERESEPLIAFDKAVGAAIDGLAEREGTLATDKAALAETESTLKAAFADEVAFEQALADIRAIDGRDINAQMERILLRGEDEAVRDICNAAREDAGDAVQAAHEGMAPPEWIKEEATDATWQRIEGLERSDWELLASLKSFAMEDAKLDAEEQRIGIDKAVFQNLMESEGVAEFKAIETAKIDGLLLHKEMATTLAEGLEARFETVKDMSYSAALVTADKMFAIADANVEDAAKDLASAQEKLTVAQAAYDNSATSPVKSGQLFFSAEATADLDAAKAALGEAEKGMGQAMVDQRALYAQATALHPEKSMAATEAWANGLYENAKEAAAEHKAQFAGAEMTKAEWAEHNAYEGIEHVTKVLARGTEGDGERLGDKATEFGEKSEVLKAQLALLTAIELKEKGVLSYAEDYFNEATGVLGEGVGEMARAGEASVEAIGNAATTAGDAVVDAATEAADAVADGATAAANAVADTASDAWDGITGGWW